MLLSDAFEAFIIDELLSEGRSQKTINSYNCTYRSFYRAVGIDLPINLIVYGHIIQWKQYMHERKNTRAHMALQLREFRRVLTYLRAHGFSTLDSTEIKIPKFTYKRTDWLTLDEVARFIGAIQNPRDKALFAALFSSGARISEILSLNRDSVIKGSAKVWGKGKKEGREEPDTLEFDDSALRLIDKYLETRTDNLRPLFISRQNRRIGVQQCIRLSHKYANEAGINKNVTTHVLRHSFGTNLEVNGADIYTMSLQMRHKKLDTTKIYLHGAELRKKQDYKKFHTETPVK